MMGAIYRNLRSAANISEMGETTAISDIIEAKSALWQNRGNFLDLEQNQRNFLDFEQNRRNFLGFD